MSPLNRLINAAAEMSGSQSWFERFVLSGATSFIAGIPFELLAVFQNMIKFPASALMFTIKIPAKIVNLVINSQSLKEFERSMPDLSDVFKTVLKIIGYAVGMFLTISLGVFKPYTNFRLHLILGLVTDIKAERLRKQAEIQEARHLEARSKAMRSHVRSMIETLKKESQRAEETARTTSRTFSESSNFISAPESV